MNEEQKIDEAMNWWYDISDHQTTELIMKHKLRKPIKEQDIVKLFALYGVNKRFIELTREDLVKSKSDLPIDKISFYDFKSSSMTRDELHKAEKITFKDGEEIKILKSRY